MKNVLAVCAHPGDAVLGCGGTLALHASRGDDVQVIVFGDGWTSRVKSLEKGLDVIDLTPLENQERAALTAIGVERVQHCRLPDNRLDNFPLLDLIKIIEKATMDFAPDVVYTNSPFDLSVDQQRTCRAVVTAFRPQPGVEVAELLAFESLSSTEWNQYETVLGFRPNCYVDIARSLGKKLVALDELTSEIRDWPHPRSREAVEHLARWRGASAGLEAAEAFMLLRSVRHFNES